MARARQRRSEESTPNSERMGTMAVKELDANSIQELLAKSRTRGAYDSALSAFLDSGSAGVQVDLEDGEFSGKKSTSIMTGFKGAIKRWPEKHEGAEPPVRLIQNDEQVYLVRTDGGAS